MIVEVIFQIRVVILDVVSKFMYPDNAKTQPRYGLGPWDSEYKSKTMTGFEISCHASLDFHSAEKKSYILLAPTLINN